MLGLNMAKRKCRDCKENISQLHGNAMFCKNCARLRQLDNAHRWWKRNNYSAVIAERRDKNKEFLKNKLPIDKIVK